MPNSTKKHLEKRDIVPIRLSMRRSPSLIINEFPDIGRSPFHITALNSLSGPNDLKKIERYVISLKKKRDHKLSSIRTFCIDIRASYVTGLRERYDYDDHIRGEIRRVFRRIQPKDQAVSDRDLLTLEEFRELITSGNPKYSCLGKFLGFTAVRIDEAAHLRNKDISKIGNGDYGLYIYGKGSKERTIPVPTELVDQVRTHWDSWGQAYLFPSAEPDRHKLDRRTLGWKLRLHSIRTIGRNVAPHDYRAFFGTHALEESPEKMKEIMAWMGIKTTEVFMRHYKKLRKQLAIRDFKFLGAA